MLLTNNVIFELNGHYNHKFSEHRIDTLDLMLELNEAMMKELIPQLGLRIKFIKKIEPFKKPVLIVEENVTFYINLKIVFKFVMHAF